MLRGFLDLDLFALMGVLVVGVFVLALARILYSWRQDNRAPRLTVEAWVTDKHAHTQSQHAGAAHGVRTTTWYYVTFRVESGDELRFSVGRAVYHNLAVGVCGRLTFQGTRFLDFG